MSSGVKKVLRHISGIQVILLYSLSYDFDREILISEYKAFCNGSTNVPDLEAYVGARITHRIE